MDGNVFCYDWEVRLMELLQAHMGALGAAFATFFTFFGEEMLLVALFGFIYWCVDKKAAKTIGISLLIAQVSNSMIKNVALRRRPYFDNDGIKCLKPVASDADIYDISAQGYSFPSAHAMNSVVMYGGLCRLVKSMAFKTVFVLLPIIVGISRVAVGVHYPTDVIVGWILGLIILFTTSYCQDKVKNQNLLRLIVFVVSCLGIIYCKTDDYYTSLGMMAGFFLSIPFEERFVDFKATKNPIRCVLRLAGGMALYLIINKALKIPFSEAFLDGGSLAAHLIRSGRYMITLFILFGIYPIIFDKIGRKEGNV